MISKKYNSETTIEKILDVSSKLFSQKGYMNTSIQNIVDEVGMSKGAIFHHFKSKEDIFYAVIDAQTKSSQKVVREWLDNMEGLSGKEKLEKILIRSIEAEDLRTLDEPIAEKMDDAKIILTMMRIDMNDTVMLIGELIQEGNEDGSLHVMQPYECAEVFLLLLNTWCDTIIFPCSFEKFKKRQAFLQTLMKNIGLDIVTDELLELQIQTLKKLYNF